MTLFHYSPSKMVGARRIELPLQRPKRRVPPLHYAPKIYSIELVSTHTFLSTREQAHPLASFGPLP